MASFVERMWVEWGHLVVEENYCGEYLQTKDKVLLKKQFLFLAQLASRFFLPYTPLWPIAVVSLLHV